MNRDPSEIKLENLLRSLVPDAPSTVLMERIDEELKLDMSWLNATARPRRRVNWLGSVGWSAVGAAAAVAVMSFLQAQPQGTLSRATAIAAAVPAPTVVPVSTTIREWDEAQDKPVTDKPRRSREQPLLVAVRERQTWLSSHSQSRITVTPPDEGQKLVLPVNFLGDAPFPPPYLQPYRP